MPHYVAVYGFFEEDIQGIFVFMELLLPVWCYRSRSFWVGAVVLTGMESDWCGNPHGGRAGAGWCSNTCWCDDPHGVGLVGQQSSLIFWHGNPMGGCYWLV